MDGKTLWEVSVHIIPIVVTIVVATIRIGKMLKDEMEAHGARMLTAVGEVEKRLTTAVGEVEKRLVSSIEAIWRDQGKQDAKISEAEKCLYRMEGRFQAIGFRVSARTNPDEQDP